MFTDAVITIFYCLCSKLANVERIVRPLLAALSTTSGSQQPSHVQDPAYVLLHYLRTISEWLISSAVKPQQDATAQQSLQLLATVLQQGAPWLSGISLPPSLVQALATKYGTLTPAADGETPAITSGLLATPTAVWVPEAEEHSLLRLSRSM
jgi:hypothetical protein